MTTDIKLFYSDLIPRSFRLELIYHFDPNEGENWAAGNIGGIPEIPNEANIYNLDLFLVEKDSSQASTEPNKHFVELGAIELEEDIHEIHIHFKANNTTIKTSKIKAKAAQQETRPPY